MRLLAIALSMFSLIAPSALASSVHDTSDGGVGFEAGSGEANDVVVSQDEAGFVVRDSGSVIRARGDCFSVNPHEAVCPHPPECFGGGCEPVTHFFQLGDRADKFRATEPSVGRTLVDGGNGDDRLIADPIQAVFRGGAGDDRLIGGREPDSFVGGPGADYMKGNGGEDHVSYHSVTAPLVVSIDGTANDGAAGEGDNVQVESVGGGQAADRLVGNGYANGLYGARGADRILGGGGNDTLGGDEGNDSLRGGGGDDSLHLLTPDPGSGSDRARCGTGEDTVFYDGRDLIASDCEQHFKW